MGNGRGTGQAHTCDSCTPEIPQASERIERYCELMHDAYEQAAVGAGWETQQASRKPWADVPEANKVTMRTAVAALLAATDAEVKSREPEGEALEQMRQWYDDMEGPGPDEGDAVITREPGEILSVLSAAEVKSMCETATELGRRLGRKEAADEFHLLGATLTEFANNDRTRMRQSTDALARVTYKHRADGYGDSAEAIERVARNLTSYAQEATSNGLTASSRHPGTPEDTKPPQERSCDCYKLPRAADGVLRHHPRCELTPDLPEESDQ